MMAESGGTGGGARAGVGAGASAGAVRGGASIEAWGIGAGAVGERTKLDSLIQIW